MRANQLLQSEMIGHVKERQYSGLSQIGCRQEQGISFSKFYYSTKSGEEQLLFPDFCAVLITDYNHRGRLAVSRLCAEQRLF